MNTLQKGYDLIEQLSVKELRVLNSAIVDEIKLKRKREAKRMLRELEVGQEVTLNKEGDKHHGKTFVVDKINRTRAKCHIKGNKMMVFNIPPSLMKI